MSGIKVYTQAKLNAALKSLKGGDWIELWGSALFEVGDSSQLTACGSSQVTAYDSSQVTASKYVAVTFRTGRPRVTGGVQIHPQYPKTGKEWCDDYGVEVKKGVAILYKAVRADYRSAHGTSYAPGESPKATDWDGGTKECDGGLHFCPVPALALSFDHEATKFVACPVKVSEIAVHKNPEFPNKVKAPRICAPCYEVDVHGNRIEAKT